MKRKILFVVLFVVLLSALLAISPLGQSKLTVDLVDTSVWKILSESGEVTLCYDFFEGLENAEDGDTLTLVPDRIELDRIFTLKSGKSFTIDLGDSKIVYPNNTITEPVLNIRGSTDVTVLANGAEVYLQNNVRSFISVIDSAGLTVYGEGDGLSIYAPDAVDASGNATVELHNVYFMKNSGNMMGLLCARGSSTVTAYDSTFVSKGGGNAVYTCASGQMSLYNSRVVSLDNTNAAQIADSSTLYAEGTVFSSAIKNSGGLIVGEGCYLPRGSSFSVAEGNVSLDCSLTAAITARSFTAPDGYNTVIAVPCDVSYCITGAPSVSDLPNDDSVWRVENNGEQYYTDSFYYPLVSSGEGDVLTLLRDVALPSLGQSALMARSVDLGSHSISLALPEGLSPNDGTSLLNVVGTGEFALTASGELALTIELLHSSRRTELNLSGAVLELTSAATVNGTDLIVTGGDVHTTGVAYATIGQGDIYLTDTTVISNTLAVSSGREVYAEAALVASLTDATAVLAFGSLALGDDCFIHGGVSASGVTASDSVYFNTPPTSDLDFLLKPLIEPAANEKYPELTFGYRASKLVGEVRAAFAMSNDVTLLVYIPEYVYSDDTFTLIAVDGIVYTPVASDASHVELDGEQYLCFSYPYIYASDIDERAELRISASGVDFDYNFTVRELMLSSFAAGESTSFKCAAATYLDYAFEVTGYTPDAEIEAALYPFISVESIPVPTAPDMLRTVFFDSENGVISLYSAESVSLEGAVIKWGNTSVTVSAEDGVLYLPYLRLDPSVTFELRYTRDGSLRTAELGILSLYATVHGSTGNSTELFERYLNYLILISRL